MVDDQAFVADLQSLQPASTGQSFEQLCYRAGVAVGRRHARGWMCTSAALLLAMVSTSGEGKREIAPPPLASRAQKPVEPMRSTEIASDDLTCARLGELVVARGWESLPLPPSCGPAPVEASRGTD